MLGRPSASLKLIVSLIVGICLTGLLLVSLRLAQAAKMTSPEYLAPVYTIELVPDQMDLSGDVTTHDNCVHPVVCSWLEDTLRGTIMLGVDPTSPDPTTWDGGSATVEVYLRNEYSPTLVVLKLFWPEQDGRGLGASQRDRLRIITLDGQPIWGIRTIHPGGLNGYYAPEHGPILTTIVVTQSMTHTLSFSVSAGAAWDLSRIELSAYPYPTTIKGIGYSPYRDCQYPDGDLQPSVQDMQEDLFRLLHTSNAIRTYSARGSNGRIPALANAIGLPVYAGAWIDASPGDPDEVQEDDAEIEALIELACTTDLEGAIVGNEYYLRSERTITDANYLLSRIRQVRDGIRTECGRDLPLTTAEVDDLIFEWETLDAVIPEKVKPHFDPILDEIDFVMVHIYPFWNGMPIDGAASFTVRRYKAIQDLIEHDYAGKRVIIGEAGWPSAGAPYSREEPGGGTGGASYGGNGNEGLAVPSLENQRRYMLEFLHLAEREDVEFMYFDAFDELWKIEEAGRVGQHWGYSYFDRAAKHNFYGVLLPGEVLFPYQVYLPYIARQSTYGVYRSPSGVELPDTPRPSLIRATSNISPVYTEWPMGPGDVFVPSGWMGYTKTLGLYECDRTKPYSGEMAIRASFSPTSTDSWAGIYWQHPENNWGDKVTKGIPLDEATYLRFHARGAQGGEQVKFLMGGIWGDYPDSQQPALSTDVITLTQEWLTYTLDLRGRDLSRVIGGFAFVTDGCLNPQPITFYLDDIEYVLEGDPGPPAPTPTPETPYTFDVYRDRDIAGNHYVPSGWMGDAGDIQLDECWRENTHTGSTAIRVEYTPQVTDSYKWAGVYWQDPAKNWGDRPGGYDLTEARAVTFWAKGERGGERISFKVGGIGCESADYPDTLCPVHVLDPAPIGLTDTWDVYTMPLDAELDLSGSVGGFLWVASKTDNPNGMTFYLDDIQYLFNADILIPFFPAPGPIFGTGWDRTFALDFGDADSDGDLDLAVGNHGQNQICWNAGSGTFECKSAFGGNATFDLDWGDMDQDGDLDLVVANSSGQPNQVWVNDGDHMFTPTNFSTCSVRGQFCRTSLGDVDGDGDLDIALAIWQPQDLIYYNDGDGTFSTTATTCTDSGWTRDLEFGDMDRDGDLDLVVVGDSPDYVCINDGRGTFTETRWLPWKKDSTRSVALGDADGDGDLDIAAGESAWGAIKVFLNNGQGYFTQTLLVGPASDETFDIAWADIDNDGDLDIVAGNSGQRSVIYFNDQATDGHSIIFTRTVFLGTGSGRTNSLALGDVDNDCDLDLAMSRDRGQNVIYLNVLNRSCVRLPIIIKDYP
jgi:exo-beta-1,3-glucanase (GH17 family)